MSVHFRVVNWGIRSILQTICQIDMKEFKKVPRNGPYIMVANHINFLEVPAFLSHIDDPMFTGLAKRETWNNPVFHVLFNMWGAIPLDREVIDRDAFQRSFEALSRGQIVAIAPEGTRSKHGRLQQGKTGILILALRCQVPIIPVAFFGYENFWSDVKHLRRSEFHLKVGAPFHLKVDNRYPSRIERQAVVDEIMYKIAELLPEKYRGFYQYEDKIRYQFLQN